MRDEARTILRRKFGNHLRELRDVSGLSQEQVAQALGVHRRTVGEYESGDSEPGALDVGPLARLYGVTVVQLLSFKQ